MVGAMHEYEASPTPTNALKTRKSQNFYLKKNEKLSFILRINFDFNLKERTSFGTKAPSRVVSDQNPTPNMIIHFRSYLSPRYPNRGANNI